MWLTEEAIEASIREKKENEEKKIHMEYSMGREGREQKSVNSRQRHLEIKKKKNRRLKLVFNLCTCLKFLFQSLY